MTSSEMTGFITSINDKTVFHCGRRLIAPENQEWQAFFTASAFDPGTFSSAVDQYFREGNKFDLDTTCSSIRAIYFRNRKLQREAYESSRFGNVCGCIRPQKLVWIAVGHNGKVLDFKNGDVSMLKREFHALELAPCPWCRHGEMTPEKEAAVKAAFMPDKVEPAGSFSAPGSPYKAPYGGDLAIREWLRYRGVLG